MASIYELALCSQAVYSDNPRVDGWGLIRFFNYPSVGFFAAIFHKNHEEFVLAIRGTDQVLHDVPSDLRITVGLPPKQAWQARFSCRKAYELAHMRPLTLTGHSLGGGLASYASAVQTALPVVTFNSPGMYNSVTGGFWGIAYQSRQLENNTNGIRTYIDEHNKAIHLRSEGDMVSTGTGAHIINNRITINDNPSCSGLRFSFIKRAKYRLCTHSIDNMVEVISRNEKFKEEINWA
ncbi:Mbeg1-like protein [Marinobacterium stanieri]|uniref:Lipase (Class 3) n=1 Tax=Marinobacterium stanieri TaxID=49186 RepID=A0A1N6VQS1_9GAMM|nr:Mbeg1-like protein [Marinobacterium stanieri]SIQ80211.1 Protein of unknown function [Marinobacterium stanieri]